MTHFFALHVLQVFPLMGLLAASTRLRQASQVVATWRFAVLYVGGVWWLFAEAMRGRPLLANYIELSRCTCECMCWHRNAKDAKVHAKDGKVLATKAKV